MSLSQTLNFLLTPLAMGLVGYGTNWLAIKMLFRPHRASVLSFGWQGVIPKNRAKLAREIGHLVGDKLLRKDDIREAFFNRSVQERMERAVEHEMIAFLEKDYGTLADIIAKTGYQPETVISAALRTLNAGGMLDRMFDAAADDILRSVYGYKLSGLQDYKDGLKTAIDSFLSSQKLQEETGNAVSAYINNFVLSGKSLADIVPQTMTDRIPAFSKFVTDKILDSLETAFDDPEVREKTAVKLIEMKNNHFSEGTVDQMKLGFLNMFLNEETIRDLVDKYLPKLISSVKQSNDVRGRIEYALTGYVSEIVRKPLYKHADSIGLDTVFSLKSSLVTAIQRAIGSEDISEKICTKLMDYVRANPDKTLGEIIEAAGLTETIEGKIRLMVRPSGDKLTGMICGFCEKVEVNNVYRYIPKKMFGRIKSMFIKQINGIVEKNLDRIVDSVNLPKITENRINSLNLYEVETLLFSFMSDSFKWINILGFVLGFLFGLAQMLFIYSIS
ncbi:DUF445 family protein [Seleniivibrio woodruffii]|uniref:Uncharacterized membrane protein YheB (UPF0754 family) n=1 Tax=Seleniivibrio woodruffii TaxID=1078050 RepID=A0A4R1K9C3_9BACT|nr:DUF445 family protein [Seleniivibrio woodruffii]TCK60986.1 uncharacterized membrane protein YheB (UPF0754 family) [Seleniivibrio woodruffii]TVZ36616.1 uncharacterized membrane protein YheB (UPF0754 family) [Seleniivibrio woodruffii]